MVEKGRAYATDATSVIFFPEQGEYWEYEYDLLNRLTKVHKDGSVVAEYVYDENGLRLKKKGSGKETMKR